MHVAECDVFKLVTRYAYAPVYNTIFGTVKMPANETRRTGAVR